MSAAALLIRITPATMRGRANVAWSTAFLLGSIAGPVLGGALIRLGLRTSFLIYADLVLVATLLAVGLGCPALRHRVTPPVGPPGAGVTLRAALRNRAFRPLWPRTSSTGRRC